MLNQPAPFPHPGSSAFIAAAAPDLDPRQCTVLRHNRDGTLLVALVSLPGELRGASHNREVARAELFEHLVDAMPAQPRRRRMAR